VLREDQRNSHSSDGEGGGHRAGIEVGVDDVEVALTQQAPESKSVRRTKTSPHRVRHQNVDGNAGMLERAAKRAVAGARNGDAMIAAPERDGELNHVAFGAPDGE
jgi:hypothetical protein